MLTALQLLALPVAALLSPIYAVWVLARGRGGAVRHTASRRMRVEPNELFRLLDPNDADNRWRRRGCTLTPIPGNPQHIRFVDPRIADQPMVLTVLQSEPGEIIAFATKPETPLNSDALEGAASCYDFRPCAEGVLVTHQEFMQFRADLSIFAHAFHELLMRFAIAIDLAKLAHDVEAVSAGPSAAAA